MAASAPPRTILAYVGLDLMGDALMKMPFVRALRETYPQARITWLAGKGKTVFSGPLAPLVKGLIDEVIEDAGIGSDWTELFRRPLPGRHFDLVIDTQRRVLTTLILRRLDCDRFISGAMDFASQTGARTLALTGTNTGGNNIGAAIGDNGVIAYRVQEQPKLKTVEDPAFPKEYFGIVVKQGNKALLDKLNAGLSGIKADGTYATLYRKWFKADPPTLPAQ